MPIKTLSSLVFLTSALTSTAQTTSVADSIKDQLDSLYISETEGSNRGKSKVLHAEPLFIDLIRDLGARKGEKEWNVGIGMTDRNQFDNYTALVEYEFAPVDRLGVEVELPFTFYAPTQVASNSTPQNRLKSLKLAAQYSFLVDTARSISLAVGYIHEFDLIPFRRYGKQQLVTGHVFNPFLIAAKRWTDNWHSLLYTGPEIHRYNATRKSSLRWQVNTSAHYMIRGTRNFIGVELNQEVAKGGYDMTIRPQMRVGLADNLLVGIVSGIPISRKNERLSSFVRLIYEPGHKHRHTKHG